MKGRARQACLLLVLLCQPASLAAAEDAQKDWCRPQQTYFDSYERASSSLKFAVRELGGAIHCNRDDIASASTVIIALFTVVIVCYTISLAKSTKFSALIAEKAPIELERPWVILDGAMIIRRERDDETPIPHTKIQEHWQITSDHRVMPVRDNR